MHIIAATFLLPVGVVIYTFVGGIKATFLTDYFHTFVITIIICFFTIKTFTVPEIGSIGGLYDIISNLAQQHPVPGNQDGSYLTLTSKNVSKNLISKYMHYHYMYKLVLAYLYTCILIYLNIYILEHLYTCILVYLYTYILVHLYACILVYIYIICYMNT